MADIIVYDRDGNKIEKKGIETIELDTTTEGKTTIFTHGIAMDNVPIVVDFSSGNMTIDGGGYLVRSAIIKKPENLIPENIADGVNVAGVVGTHAGSGGAETHTVTFMSDDGATVLYEKQVTVGDTCGDIVALGLIDTPTKESTAQYNYTYSGWSLTSGGAADSTVLENITADKTVYAAYTSEVIYYTVRFYDGETLVDTVQVPYGGTADTGYTKEGYILVEWKPSNANITQDTDCYGTFEVATAFGTDSWADIAAYVRSGEAKTRYAIGDKKRILHTYSDGTQENVEVEVLAFDRHAAQGSDEAAYRTINTMDIGMTSVLLGFGKVSHTVYKTSQVKSQPYSYTSWMLDEHLNDVFDSMPDDVKAVVCASKRETMNISSVSVMDTSDKKLYPYSLTEVGLTEGYSGKKLGSKYDKATVIKGNTYWTRSQASGKLYYVSSAGSKSGVSYTDKTTKHYLSYTFTL